MFYHKCIPNFADLKDPDLDNKVLEEIIKFNSSTLNLNIENRQKNKITTIEEPDQLGIARHQFHINNMFIKNKVPKINAIFVLSNRDYIQGGELMFDNWEEAPRVDNYGVVIGQAEDCQPTELNEQGTLIIYPAIEKVWSRRVISGKLELKLYSVEGDNYS